MLERFSCYHPQNAVAYNGRLLAFTYANQVPISAPKLALILAKSVLLIVGSVVTMNGGDSSLLSGMGSGYCLCSTNMCNFWLPRIQLVIFFMAGWLPTFNVSINASYNRGGDPRSVALSHCIGKTAEKLSV